MKRYAVIQHTYSEFLGLIEAQLEKRDIGFLYFRPFVGQDLPATALHFDAMFALGGDASLGEAGWQQDELRLFDVFMRAGRPVIGVGYGGMLMAEWAGGRVVDASGHQARWTTAHKTAAGEGDLVAEALHGRRVMVLHRGDIELPDTVEPIVVDDEGRWLAIHPHTLGYGLLCRPELKPGMIEDMIMEEGRANPDNIGQLLTDARAEWHASQQTTDQLVVALVKSLDLMQERHKPPVFHLKVEP